MPKVKVITDRVNNYFTNNKITVGTAAPTTGAHTSGDIVVSSSVKGETFGWVCTVSGTPGTWKALNSDNGAANSIPWNNVTGKPSTYAPTIGTTSTTAFRGDYGNTAYNHSQTAHAPSNAQRNADITKAEIEAKLTGDLGSHIHSIAPIVDTRDTNPTPAECAKGLTNNFKNASKVNMTSFATYVPVATVKPWNDSSGGCAHQFAYDYDSKNNPKPSIRTAPISSTTWGRWYRLFNESDSLINVAKPETGDYGYGFEGNPGAFIGAYPGWMKNTMYLNTISTPGDGVETKVFDKVKINGDAVDVVGALNVGTLARIPEIQDEVKFRQNPSNPWVDPWVNQGCAIKTNGHIATDGTVAAREFYLGWDFGQCSVGVGNGDNATYESHNMKIRSWYGLGFHNNQDECTVVMNTRTGDINAKGIITSDACMRIGGKYLFLQWNDPGAVAEGSIWIKS